MHMTNGLKQLRALKIYHKSKNTYIILIIGNCAKNRLTVLIIY